MIKLSVLRHEDFSVDVQVVESEHLPFEIFLYRIDTNDAEMYTGVCSMKELNIHLEPSISDPFFRKSLFNIKLNSASELEEYIAEITSKVEQLEEDYIIYLESTYYNVEQIIEIGS